MSKLSEAESSASGSVKGMVRKYLANPDLALSCKSKKREREVKPDGKISVYDALNKRRKGK